MHVLHICTISKNLTIPFCYFTSFQIDIEFCESKRHIHRELATICEQQRHI